MDYKVKDLKLAESGRARIDWAFSEMDVLSSIRKQFENEKPFKGIRIGACLHVTAETAALCITLQSAGAEVYLCASNPLSTQDDVAASLVQDFGVSVFAVRGESREEYYSNIRSVINKNPQVTIDDGCDLVSEVTSSWDRILDKPWFGLEETTTGVIRLKAMAEKGVLKYPILAVNESLTKHLFDNRYGTGQSVVDGVLRATNRLLAGKFVVVCGYGWCGKGIASRFAGLGARVGVSEVDPIKALEAVMDGFEVDRLTNLIPKADIVITATGNRSVVTVDMFKLAKPGTVFANAGHFDVELELAPIKKLLKPVTGRHEVYEFDIEGKKLFVLGQGRLVNLACAEGHPSAVMDLSFANQAMGVRFMLENYTKLENKVYTLPIELDRNIAKLKLEGLGVTIDKLTEDQKTYLAAYEFGT